MRNSQRPWNAEIKSARVGPHGKAMTIASQIPHMAAFKFPFAPRKRFQDPVGLGERRPSTDATDESDRKCRSENNTENCEPVQVGVSHGWPEKIGGPSYNFNSTIVAPAPPSF